MDTLKVRDIVQGRDAVQRFKGHYRFEDIRTEGDVTCDWEISPKVAGIHVRGYVRADLLLECARCLSPYDVPLAMTLDENYVFSRYVDPFEGKERELQAEDYYETVDEEGLLDLKDLVHQFLVMESTVHLTCGGSSCGFEQVEASVN